MWKPSALWCTVLTSVWTAGHRKPQEEGRERFAQLVRSKGRGTREFMALVRFIEMLDLDSEL